MFGNKRLPVAAILGGLVALVALAGCGGNQSVAHGGMDHSRMAHGGMEPSEKPMEDMDHSGMAMGGMEPAESVAVAASPGQPATTLSPNALDAPAATSVADAQRSAEMAEEMRGAAGHGGHGSGTYRQVDAGRGPEAYEGSEPQTPGAGPHHHGSTMPAPSGQEGGHAHESPAGGAAKEEAAVYACPMHPEVTSRTPGKCPKCGMTLVKRRKG